MRPYDHKKIEKKWQKEWARKKLYKTEETSNKPKFYILDMFPYPSGTGLHVGHPRGYIATDIYSRYKKMNGFNVLHPMGWDSFGLPAENYAIKMKTSPEKITTANIKRYKAQTAIIGLNYDWSREITTSDPAYFKWTQWAFIKMWEKGLVFESNEPINWCPSCLTGLANEDLDGDKCERCGTKIEKKPLRQWVIRITDYADRLLTDINALEWPESIKESQRNWIGRSEGAEIEFKLKHIHGQQDGKHAVKVFTTRPDTLFGVTYLAISAELAKKWLDVGWQTTPTIKKYIEQTLVENATRDFSEKAKTGVFSEVYAINPVNAEEVPVWITNYVLGDVGTGAVMAVPAHDERDFAFAVKYKLPINQVVVEVKDDYTNLCKVRADKKTVNRRSVVCILKHWKEDKYLCLDWKQTNWHTPVTGGMEAGETPEETGRREIMEETGYKNFKFIGQGLDVVGSYYNPIKDCNRFEQQTPVFFVLTNNEQEKVSAEETAKHELVWLDKGKVELFLNHDTANYDARVALHVWSQYLNPNAVIGAGVLINSAKFNGVSNEEAKKLITKEAGGKMTTTYKLKDWVFSRQRYWGEPIPLIHCPKCGVVAVPEKDLPLKLPKVKYYEPTGTGESPLADIKKWVNVKCPKCKSRALRETNTMPQWAGSSWYHLRYIDPKNKKALVDPKKEKYWSPVDFYVGGTEHATRHLIYARFWHKFLYDIGVVSRGEPFMKLMNQGMILGSDGRKMSKRWGNVVNPDDVVRDFGADTLRVYESFMGPFKEEITWSTDNMVGSRRFLEKIWRFADKVQMSATDSKEVEVMLHKTIKKVTEDILNFNFNTAISAFMILANTIDKVEVISQSAYESILKLLTPFAPHITEEMWSILKHKKSIYLESWPVHNENLLVAGDMKIAIQVNGKVRAALTVPTSTTEAEIRQMALAMPEVVKWVGESVPKKVIYIPGKIVSIVL